MNYDDMTAEQLDAASQAIQREMDAARATGRAELLQIQKVRDERAKTERVDRLLRGLSPAERVDRLLRGLSPAEREAFMAKAAKAQTMGMGEIATGEQVPGIG